MWKALWFFEESNCSPALVKLPTYFSNFYRSNFCLQHPILSWWMFWFNKFDFIDSNSQQFTVYALKMFFFPIRVFFYEYPRITGLHGKGEGISLTPRYHFHPLHIYLDISRAITAESSPLHIASNRTRTGNLWFSGASH